MRKILMLLFAALSLMAHADSFYTTDTKDYEGKIVVIKAVIYNDTTNFATSSKTVVYLYNGEDYLRPYTQAQADSAFAVDPYRFYWVISKAPSTASSSYYYLSALKGDSYIGAATGKNLATGSWNGKTVTSTENYKAEFPILSFDKMGRDERSGYTGTAYNVKGVSMRFDYNGQNRWLAVSEKGEVNWIGHTSNGEYLNNVRWTTNLELVEVTQAEAYGSYGTLDAPTEYGFKVTLGRSDDGKLVTEDEDYNYYGTLRLPYAVELPEGMKAYKISQKTNISNAQVGLTELKNETTNTLSGSSKNVLARETPVLLCFERTNNDAATSKTFYLRPEKAQTITATGFSGSLGAKTYPDSVYRGASDTLTYYILTKAGGRVAFRPMSNKTIAANKAFFEWRKSDAQSGAKPATLSFFFTDDDETTAIAQPATGVTDDDQPYYDLQGCRIAAPTRPGIYVRGNKKVLVK